jgi:hypothetical protein
MRIPRAGNASIAIRSPIHTASEMDPMAQAAFDQIKTGTSLKVTANVCVWGGGGGGGGERERERGEGHLPLRLVLVRLHRLPAY